jgi:hypothetical protein
VLRLGRGWPSLAAQPLATPWAAKKPKVIIARPTTMIGSGDATDTTGGDATRPLGLAWIAGQQLPGLADAFRAWLISAAAAWNW